MKVLFKNFYLKILLSFVLISYSCSDDSYIAVEVSPVNYNLDEMPYNSLSQYNFFVGEMKNLNPVYGVIPYELISSLFTDYSIKSRFLWMPEGVSANYISSSDVFDFPIGTVLIKNFSYENVMPDQVPKNIETRLMIKKENGWEHVAGMCIGQDISDRPAQFATQPPMFNLGKSFDTYGPMGPYLVSPDSLDNCESLDLECKLNGKTMQKDNTSDLIFDVPTIISYLSEIVTL